MDKRADADYSPEVEFDNDEATIILNKTVEFIVKMRNLIEKEIQT